MATEQKPKTPVRKTYTYQPIKGKLGMDLGDLNEYDFDPLPTKKAEENLWQMTSHAK